MIFIGIQLKISYENHELIIVKQAYFSNFYKSIKGTEFNNEALIFDKIDIEDIILLGINSNSIVDQNGGHGFLPLEKFETELKHYRETYPSKELILCLHHNLEGEHEDTHFGQWNKENKKDLVAIFDRYNIKCILNGNEHTPNSKYISGTEIIVSDSGAFSSLNSIEASFKTYEIKIDGNNLYLENSTYGLRKINGVSESNFGSWVKYSYEDIKSTEIKNFVLRRVPSNKKQDVIELPTPLEAEVNTDIKSDTYTDKVVYENDAVQNKLYKIIKEKKLFHQGHFHWSETSRAHNWIDIARLLEDKEDLYFINNAVIDVIEKMNLITNIDLIIGLGYEGNIISSKASIKYDIPYTFLPYSYRWKDHNEFENKLNFENEDKRFKKVLLITDVVNDGRTIRKLVGKENREKKFFDNVEQIIVVSLFYTGQEEINNDILNYDKLPSKQKEGDEIVNNIEFYTIKHLKVEKCPYGENYKNECFILKDNLHCVHKFYTEE
jgi:orotate phosphoribosyltransferase